MYAVIETGGKQYRVEVGTELEIERVDGAPGDSIAFDRILLVADGDAASIGRPVVANASVAAEVVRRDRGEKVISFKYRPKARRRVKKGHRQELTVVRISDIVLDGKSAAEEHARAEEQRRTERGRLEQAARRQAEQDAALAAKLAAEKPAKAAGDSTEAKSGARSRTKAGGTEKASGTTGKADASGSKGATARKGKEASGESPAAADGATGRSRDSKTDASKTDDDKG